MPKTPGTLAECTVQDGGLEEVKLETPIVKEDACCNLFWSQSSYTYLKYKCVSKIKNITAYSTFELDKKSGLARSAAWVDVYPKKSYQTRRIIKWGDKIIMAPLMQKGDYKNSYFENDVHHMYLQGQLYTGWSKRKCKKVEAR